MFPADLAAISRISARMLAISRCWRAGSVNAGSTPHDLVVLTKSPQDGLVDALPNTCLHPFLKTTPARHTAATAELAPQALSRYSGSEHRRNSR